MPTTLYPATTREFDAFDEAFIGSNPEARDNSHLGIWFGATPADEKDGQVHMPVVLRPAGILSIRDLEPLPGPAPRG